jgi:hypothetical protein
MKDTKDKDSAVEGDTMTLQPEDNTRDNTYKCWLCPLSKKSRMGKQGLTHHLLAK